MNTTTRTIATITSIVGGLAMITMLGSATLTAVFEATAISGRGSSAPVQTTTVDGVDSLRIESNASDFTLRFDDVTEATLQIEGQRSQNWRLGVERGTLVVESARPFPGFCLGWCLERGEEVTLTLPAHLDGAGLDASIEVNAGSFTADGEFDELDLSLSAGAILFDGSARVLGASVSAGRAELVTEGVDEATFDVSAGRIVAELTGEAPRSVDLEVSAGNLDVTLPDVGYELSSEVSAGSLDNRLNATARCDRSIAAWVSAGRVVLRPGSSAR